MCVCGGGGGGGRREREQQNYTVIIIIHVVAFKSVVAGGVKQLLSSPLRCRCLSYTWWISWCCPPG